MKLANSLLSYSLVIAAAIAAPLVSAAAPENAIIVTGLQTPESVVHDPLLDVYLVSNVGVGDPSALDGNGFISRISPDGAVLQLQWIQSGVNSVVLNGPKGIWLHGENLYVADIDTLRIFNRFTGAPVQNISIPNPFAPSALFLNDVVVANDGTVYLTDNQNSGLFKVDPQGNASVIATGDSLGYPNGILTHNGNVSWVTWLSNQVLERTSDGQQSVVATLPAVDVSQFGLPPNALLLDGYVHLPTGSLLVSSWATGKVYKVNPRSGATTTLAQFVSIFDNPNNPDGPADINVDLPRNRLLVPLFDANELVIQPLPPGALL